ncbi:hypothetical protein, partial [Pasteurella multocida]|uniref:hypothetical protein n=1 Tax=Pasteurella multocida TaxID=747 RepID=UPI00227BDDB7
PLQYMQNYINEKGFKNVVDSHYLPSNILEWVTLEDMPINALDEFIEARIELIIDELRKLLEGIEFDVIDTKNLDK